MKRIFKLVALTLFVAAFAACDDDKSYPDPGLEVSANNLAGTWQLAEWNGAPLAEGSYVYLELIRKDRLFKMYQNIDSFSPRLTTGRYALETISSVGTVIRGIYDNSLETEWKHRYIVRDLTAERMVWVATDDSEDIQVYVRAEIPGDITGGDKE